MTTLFISSIGKELNSNTIHSVFCNTRYYLGAKSVRMHNAFINAIIVNLDLSYEDVKDLTGFIHDVSASTEDIEFIPIVSKELFNNDTIITL